MTDTTERRQGLRYPIPLHVELERGKGLTWNISTSGVLFETDQVFPAGAPIRLTLFLNSTQSGIPTCLHCQGRVVRAEKRGEKTGFAVAFTSYQFKALGSGGGT